jgi:ribonuclease J
LAKKNNRPTLKIIPLGGIGEIGKNMTVIEYGNDIIVVDCGLSFPDEDMLGIDLVIPDATYLQQNKEKIRGFVITHGHEDHIGAITFILKELMIPIPIYATRFTLGMIGLKLKEHRMNDVKTHPIAPGESVKLGVFDVEFINVNHSICGAVALAIGTPVGMVVHTGDFKVDFTPTSGNPINLQRFGEIGAKGVLALLMDSTNAERSGYTHSEQEVSETINRCFDEAKGRIVVAMFASNVYRIQQVVNAAVHYDRYVVFNGRSMVNVSTLAQEQGELIIPEGRLIDVSDIDFYDEDEIVIITTGSQGEELAGLTRMAFSEHRKLDIRQTDTIILSATAVPGNERYVSRVINQLFKKGANVIYDALEDVHVSGHACQEELKLMHTLIKPKYFLPVHGENRHLESHIRLAESLGMPTENIFRMQTGDVVEFTRRSARITGTVPTGSVLVDGLGVGDVGNVVLKDRKYLSQDGLLVVVAAVDTEHGEIISSPEVVSRGFVYEKESEELLDGARKAAAKALAACISRGSDINTMRNEMRDSVKSYLRQKTKRYPMVLPMVIEV